MVIGLGANRLERRITEALCGGRLHLKKSKFLQDISQKLGLYRERTHLSALQASFLFTILTRAESGNASRPSKTRMPAPSIRSVVRHHPLLEDTSELSRLRELAGVNNVIWTDDEPFVSRLLRKVDCGQK